jgi:glycine betaine/proline transport system substrate-binding protein
MTGHGRALDSREGWLPGGGGPNNKEIFMRNKRLMAILAAALMTVGMLVGGCAPENSDGNETVNLIYVQWACAESQTHIAQAVLEDMGYKVDLTTVAAGPMWTGVASGDADAFVCGWLPYTHESYMQEYGEQLEDLGPNFEGARIGLVAPQYVEIDSIAELNSVGDQFDWTIYGIEPGSGLMQHTYDETVPTYGLDDWEVMDASDMAMTVALQSAYEKEEPVVVTGWAPHWKFFAFDLKFLDDPENTYGGSEKIHTITRQGFSDDMPEAAAMLSAFFLTEAQLGEVMYNVNVDGMEPAVAARQWVDANQDVVSQWTS